MCEECKKQIAALIAENETLTKIFADAPDLPETDVEWLERARLVEAERDQLKAESDRLTSLLKSWRDQAAENNVSADQLKAEIAGLKTGYEAYERVNAELKGEVEGLRNALRPLLAHWDDLRPGESINVDAARAALGQGGDKQ